MKTFSRQQNKREKKTATQKILIVFVPFFIIAVLNIQNIQPFSRLSLGIAEPVWKVQRSIHKSVDAYFSLLQSKKQLVQKNVDLEQALKETEGLRVLNDALRLENTELKHLLGRDKVTGSVLATVISRPNTSPYDTLIVDIGTNENVRAGDTVVALGDFAVGYINKVFGDTAQVTLYSSPGQKTNILIGTSTVPATATGRGAGNFFAELPRDAEIQKGDVIVLTSFNTQVFGEVTEILRTSTDAFQTVLFTIPIDIFSIRWVEIIRQ